MTRIPLFIDNATCGSGYTPIITPILGEYLCIKLNIDNFLDSSRIAFQFSHELCHYVFYSLKGLNKKLADESEETTCTAMSLCMISELTQELPGYLNYVSKLENNGYRD